MLGGIAGGRKCRLLRSDARNGHPSWRGRVRSSHRRRRHSALFPAPALFEASSRDAIHSSAAGTESQFTGRRCRARQEAFGHWRPGATRSYSVTGPTAAAAPAVRPALFGLGAEDSFDDEQPCKAGFFDDNDA